MCLTLELLVRVGRDDFGSIQVFVDVVYCDSVIFREGVGHDKVLFNSGGKHGVPTIVDVLPDDVNSTRRSDEKCWLLVELALKPFQQINESGLMLFAK
jgi:hypothetical protein